MRLSEYATLWRLQRARLLFEEHFQRYLAFQAGQLGERLAWPARLLLVKPF
jgi:hypothetical protein